MLLRLIKAFLLGRDPYPIDSQLDQATQLLAGYQRSLRSSSQFQMDAVKALLEEDRLLRAQEKRENVEPDFLVLLWATVAFGLTLGGYAAKQVPALSVDLQPTINNAVWLFLSLGSMIFVFVNGLFAIRLTRLYAASKSDPGYKLFAASLTTGITVLAVCALTLYLVGLLSR